MQAMQLLALKGLDILAQGQRRATLGNETTANEDFPERDT